MYKKMIPKIRNHFAGAHSKTTLELFEQIVQDYDLLKEWNQEVREFLQQERNQPLIQVTF